jgi:hypothetical protein
MSMKQKPGNLSLRNVMVVFALMGMTALVTGCVAPFSDLQSAKLLGKGNVEVTPSYTSVSVSDEGQTEHIQNHYGAQIGFGLAKFMDLRLRYEHISATVDEESVSANVIGFGPKFRLAKNWLAFYVPIGFAFGGDVEDGSESWQIHPTLLATLPIGKYLEINPSAKIMIPFSSDAFDTLYAFNLGLAISSDVSKWAIRPEVGICTSFEGGSFLQFSVGLSLGSGLFKK